MRMSEPVNISQEMIRLYDEYTHLTLDRRDFINKLIRITGSAAAASAVIPLLEANQARAAIVAEDDARLKTETVTYSAAAGEMSGYMARTAEATGKLPAVIVIHENRGLNPHIKDVVRRIALEGFLAFGPDFLSPLGGTPADEDQARDMIGKLDAAQTIANAVATVSFLEQHQSSNGKVGALGFCWGGGVVNQLAVNAPDLAAAVVYYGQVPQAADVAKIKAKMLLHYAGLDERINEGIPAYRKALEDAKVEHRIHIYEGVNHAFNNDTSEARYNKEAADLAWSRTVEFLQGALS
jgi:carboxymethylenebutenolidase